MQIVKGATGFELQSNPLGTLKVTGAEESQEVHSVMRVADGFTFSPSSFRVRFGDSPRSTKLSVQDNYLQVRRAYGPPKVLFR